MISSRQAQRGRYVGIVEYWIERNEKDQEMISLPLFQGGLEVKVMIRRISC